MRAKQENQVAAKRTHAPIKPTPPGVTLAPASPSDRAADDTQQCFLPMFMLFGLGAGARAARRGYGGGAGYGAGGGPGRFGGYSGYGARAGGFGPWGGGFSGGYGGYGTRAGVPGVPRGWGGYPGGYGGYGAGRWPFFF